MHKIEKRTHYQAIIIVILLLYYIIVIHYYSNPSKISVDLDQGDSGDDEKWTILDVCSRQTQQCFFMDIDLERAIDIKDDSKLFLPKQLEE